MLNRLIILSVTVFLFACGDNNKDNNSGNVTADSTQTGNALLEVNEALTDNPNEAKLYFRRAKI